MKYSTILASAGTCLVIAATGIAQTTGAQTADAQTADVTADSLMQRLEGVAPPAVLENSTLLHITEGGEIQTVREGTNGWTCMYPGGDPMCADAESVEWAKAYMSQEEPPETLGFVYMLLGDEGASNTDPYAAGETADNNWIEAGPHVMIVGSGAGPLIESYPQEVPENGGEPWVMWADTPYAHLMIPIE